MRRTLVAALVVGLGALCGAQTVNVTSDVAVSTTWTSNNTYNLQAQIYVLPGATLTIQAGTVIASTTNLGGSLAICRGARIYVQGTQTKPVIFTSLADVATWAVDGSHPTGKNPRTGTWRAAANEWGTIAIMGNGFISANNHGILPITNVATPTATNVATMEGLTAGFVGDTKVLYGGGDDYDNSGSIEYCSLRYGGKVIGLNNELNGLSLGALGRDTDINHVEIMNNVDDGVEIWGGAVNLKYVSIWNVGDDSIDCDEGWRGKVQFGLIVQGYSVIANQGSGFGDQGFEMDGAEDSDWQPVTTSVVYNCTVIGQPGARGTTAWRDGARVQFHNCIFMDGGNSATGNGDGRVVKLDNVDGDGGHGYGFNGTASWASLWTTPYTTTSTVNAPVNPGAFYTTQTSGNLIEITDSVFYHNNQANAYTEATTQGVFAAGNHNVQEPANSPIVSITRAANTLNGQGKIMQRVTQLDPRPANDALTSFASAPNDGFFTPANYRGAFAPGINWLANWTASQAFGFTPAPVAGPGQPGVPGHAMLNVNDCVNANSNVVGTPGDLNGPFYATVASGGTLTLTFNGQSNQNIFFLSAPSMNPGNFDITGLGFAGGGFIDIGTVSPVLTVSILADGTQPGFLNSLFNTGPTGTRTLAFTAAFPPGTTFNFQAAIFNTVTTLRMTNAVHVDVN